MREKWKGLEQRCFCFVKNVQMPRVAMSTNERSTLIFIITARLHSGERWKLGDVNASPLVSTRSMHFLTKLKPASLRNAVIQHENKFDASITGCVKQASCMSNNISPLGLWVIMHSPYDERRRCVKLLCLWMHAFDMCRLGRFIQRLGKLNLHISMMKRDWNDIYILNQNETHLLSSFLCNIAGRL